MGTVDRVVNKRGKVAAATEKLILDIMQEFDYQPNLMASSLSSKKKVNFAVLVPKPQSEDYWSKVFSGIEVAEKAVSDLGVVISKFLYDQDDDLQFTELASQILEAKYDGVLVAPRFHREAQDFARSLDDENIPYLFIDTFIEDTHPICSISQNDYQSGALAAKLIDYGIESGGEILSISNLTNTDNFDLMQERSNGFKSFFENPANEKRIIHSIEIVNLKFQNLASFLDEKLVQCPNIKGIFINNSKAHMVARYLSESNILSIKLVGFDLIEQNIKYLDNGIIDFILFDYAEKQGETGIQILFDYIMKNKKPASKINMPIHIVAKENLEGFLS